MLFACVLLWSRKGQISLYKGQSCKWWDSVWSWQPSLIVICVKEYCYCLKWCCHVQLLLLEKFLFLSDQQTASKSQFCTVKIMEKMGVNCDIVCLSSISSWVVKSWKSHYLGPAQVCFQYPTRYVDEGLPVSWTLLESRKSALLTVWHEERSGLVMMKCYEYSQKYG